MTITVVLADDHRLLREGLRSLLSAEADMRVVGEASDGRKAVQLVQAVCPDVAVMDIGMQHLNGIDATRQIHAHSPETRVLALSTHSDKRYVLAMLQAGAAGYVLKSAAGDDLVQALRAVHRGECYLSPAVAGAVVGRCIGNDPVEEDHGHDLGPREREVVQLIAEGSTSKEIGCQMHISVKTVESHRRNIMRKLGLHSVAALTKYAVRQGLTALGE
jgi:DNA-binding NarL/FixJ family response regulator